MYYDRIPPDSFIGKYLDYMEGVETTKVYDLFCGMWCLSTIIGRTTFVNRPRLPAYLNLFGILVGDSGVTRKSTAVDTAKKVITRFNELVRVRETVLVFDGKITPDKLEVTLGQLSEKTGGAHSALCISELAAVMGRTTSVNGLPILLTDLYDCPAVRISGGSLDRDPAVIKNCYLTFLAASTSRWLARAVSPDVIEGGFTSRCFFVIGEKRKRRDAWPDDQRAGSIDELANMLVAIRKRAKEIGPLELTPSAREAFKQWYETIQFAEDAYSASFSSRIDAHVLCVAGLLAINNGVWEIQVHELRNAIQIVNELFENGRKLFDEVKLVETEMTKAIQRLLDQLIKSGATGIIQSVLYKKVRHAMTKGQFDDLLSTLHELDMVQKFVVPAPGRPPKTVWRATAALNDPKLLDQLFDVYATKE